MERREENVAETRNELDAKRISADDLCQNQELPQFEVSSYEVMSTGLCTEDEEYARKMEELQDYLAMVKKIVKPGCSQEVLKLALNSMESLVKILNFMSPRPKLHASL